MKYVAVVVLGVFVGCGDDPVPKDRPPVTGQARWAVSFPGDTADGGSAVVIDSHGDVVVAGSVERTTAILTKRAGNDGSEMWTRKLVGNSWIGDIARLSDDSIVAIGSYGGTVDFGGQTRTAPANEGNEFIACYAADGTLRWLTELDGSALPLRIAADAHDHFYVLGGFVSGTIKLGDVSYTNQSESDVDTFLAAFDSSGTLLWGSASQGESPGTINGSGPAPGDIAIGANGDVLWTATFSGPISVGGVARQPDARTRTFVARYRSNGSFVDVHDIPLIAPGESSATQIEIDAEGHSVIQQIEYPVASTPFVSVHILDANGQEQCSRRLVNRGSGTPQNRTLAASPDGVVITSAWTDSPYAVDDPTSMTGSLEALEVADRTLAMSLIGDRMVGAPAQTMLNAAAVGDRGETAYVGTLTGTVAFGDTILASTAAVDPINWGDMFIVLVEP